jgi:RNA polymerase sigma factor (sigma-70 family)
VSDGINLSGIGEAAQQARAALKRFILYKGFSESDADDIIQDASVIVMRHLADGTVQEANLARPKEMGAYLFKTVKLLMVERRRRRQPGESVEGQELELAGDAGIGQMKGREQGVQDLVLKEALEQLDEDDRDLVTGLLRGESEKAAASRLGVSLGTAKMRRLRARSRLVECARKSKHWDRLQDIWALLVIFKRGSGK